MAAVRSCARLYAICPLFADTYEVLLCASFDSEGLLETHLRAFGVIKAAVLCKTSMCANHFGGVLRRAPPCDLHILCE